MSELDTIVGALRELAANDFSARVAAKAAPHVQRALVASLSAGVSPAGKAWEPRAKGGRAYEHAASRISTKSAGDVIRVTLSGPEVYGHYGVHGMPVRQMLPDAGAEIPVILTDAIERGAAEAMREVLK